MWQQMEEYGRRIETNSDLGDTPVRTMVKRRKGEFEQKGKNALEPQNN